MYLETWMLIVAVFAYGVCTYTVGKRARRHGILCGIDVTLTELVKNKIIVINEKGIYGGKGKKSIMSIPRPK